jgi:hypothetical protein
VCGKPALPLICPLGARRLRREALREEIEDEGQGKRPSISPIAEITALARTIPAVRSTAFYLEL